MASNALPQALSIALRDRRLLGNGVGLAVVGANPEASSPAIGARMEPLERLVELTSAQCDALVAELDQLGFAMPGLGASTA